MPSVFSSREGRAEQRGGESQWFIFFSTPPCGFQTFVSPPKNIPCGSAGKDSACNAGDLGLIPGLGRSPGEGKGYPLWYSGLENPMDYIVHWVAKSQRRLSDFHFTKSISGHPPCPPLIDSQLLSRLGVLMRKEGDVCDGFMPKTFVGLGTSLRV